jgi:hypothetical protein
MRRALASALACALLAACATAPTVYGPSGDRPTGYSETQVEAESWRVRFNGGADVSFRRVEDLALRRAAELTLEQGYDWFLVVDRLQEGDDDRPTRVGGSVGGYVGSGGSRGSSIGIGVSIDPSAGRKSVRLEILMRAGPAPEADPDAYDASAVLGYLGGP